MTINSQTKTMTPTDCESLLARELDHLAWIIEAAVALSTIGINEYKSLYNQRKNRLICGEQMIYVEEIGFMKGEQQGKLDAATQLRHRAASIREGTASIREGDYFEEEEEE